MRDLLESLGIVGLPRFQLDEVCAETVLTDKQLLTCILYNATQNAIWHGEADGRIIITADLADGRLHIRVHSCPGTNHDKLLSAVELEPTSGGRDLLRADRRELELLDCGNKESTFQGLSEMKAFSSAFHPPADAHIWVQPDGVLFELCVPVTVVTATAGGAQGDGHGDGEAHALPVGLTLVCCDDDDIVRMVAGLIIEKG